MRPTFTRKFWSPRHTVVACLALFTTVILSSASITYAISQNDLNSIRGGTPFYDPTATSCADSGTTAVLLGSDNEQKAYNYFLALGYTPVQSAAIIGNLMQESGVDPNAVQPNGVGHGIAQWSIHERWDGTPNDNLKDFAAGKSMTDLAVQLGFMQYELAAPYLNAARDLKTQTDITKATESFNTLYEKSADQPGSPQLLNRINFAKQALSLYGNGTTGGAGGSGCSVQCNNGSSVAGSSLSAVRQKVVCLAHHELDLWTPLPPKPRMMFLKYDQGSINDQWCADFASWIYQQSGYPFSGGYFSGGWRLAAVTQIMDLGKEEKAFHWHPSAGYTPRPGDLAIHKNDATQYSHVNIVVSVTGQKILLIGGDQGTGDNPQYFGGPNSTSVVSYATYNGSTGDSTIGYVSPD